VASKPEVPDAGTSWRGLPLALYRTSPEGRILDVNDGFVELFGYPGRDELLQIDARTLYADPQERDRWRSLIEAEGVVRSLETRFRRSDGRVFWGREAGRAALNERGTTLYYEGLVEDVSERQRAAEDHARLIRAIEQAAESIVITDPEGRIVYVNPAFECVTGYGEHEALGENPRMLHSGRQDESFYRQMWDTLGRGEVWKGSLVNRRKDGTLFEEEATIAPVFDASRCLVNYVGVKRDVTNEVELERRLLQAEKMEAIGRLAGGVAHDFNNLLGVITGYAGLALRGLSPEDAVQPRLEQILGAAQRAARLTGQLLAFSRKQALQPTVLDLNALVSDTQPLLQRLVREDVELVTALSHRLGTVRADPVQIEQILMNLAANARDAMPGGGRLTIETANVELDTSYCATHPPVRPGRYVMLALTDTGAGMDAETLAHLFEPFFTTKAPGEGTGLGLASVYGIVKQSGGHVWVYSALGVGTTFKIYLPLADEDVLADPKSESTPPPGGTESVLLVEDDPMLRDMLRETLEGHGYNVILARDGVEALRAHDEHAGAIQLLVSDVVMPGRSGLQVAELLASTRTDMKVLFISGYSDPASLRRGMIGSRFAFLSKPFAPDVFLRRVRTLLDEA
jgi:PAS domain S-box-containing protein